MKTRLRHVAQVNPQSRKFDRLADDDLVPFLPMENVWAGDKLDLSQVRAKSAVAFGYTRFQSGDVVVPKITPTFEASRSVLIPELPNSVGTGTTELHVVRPGSEIEPRYLLYVFHSYDFLKLGEAEMYGVAGQKRVPDDLIRDWIVDLPSLDEQRRIADFLDAETARIEALIEKKRRMISLLAERNQAFINQVCPGAMVRGSDGRPVGIAGMKCVRLGALAVIRGGFTMDEGRDNGADPVTLPYLRVANVLDGSVALDNIKEVTLPRSLAVRCTLRPGDVLMTEGGDPDKLGRGAVWPGDLEPCLHQNAVFAIRPDSRLLPEYLALMTRSRYARAYFEMTASKSTGIAHTSSTKITGFRVPLRPVDEQRRVVRRVHEALTTIDALDGLAERQVSLLAGRRRALITAAVTGQIDVTTAGRLAATGDNAT